jgi:hypothetical protein
MRPRLAPTDGRGDMTVFPLPPEHFFLGRMFVKRATTFGMNAKDIYSNKLRLNSLEALSSLCIHYGSHANEGNFAIDTECQSPPSRLSILCWRLELGSPELLMASVCSVHREEAGRNICQCNNGDAQHSEVQDDKDCHDCKNNYDNE